MNRREEGRCSPEERDKELHQIHEVTVLGEGNLQRKREDDSQGRADVRPTFNTEDRHRTLINMQAKKKKEPSPPRPVCVCV